jgi:hypothetical protein
MLSIAVSDGKFNELEKTFIENITQYADLLVVVNSKLKEEDPEWPEFTWDVIDVLTPENKDKFAGICADAIAQYADEFTLFFSVIDYIDDERDYHEELLECLFNLITFISAVDEGGFDPDKGATEENLRGLQFLEVSEKTELCKDFILTGDFNTADFSEFTILGANLINDQFRFYPTFPGGNSAIDNIVYTDSFKEIASGTVTKSYSDHYMLWAEFELN